MEQQPNEQPFKRVTVIGTGLIGASVAALLKGRAVADEVVGVDREQSHLAIAERLGFIDRGLVDPARAVIGSDAVVLAVPLDEVFKVMDAIGPDVRPGALITCTAGTTSRLLTQLVRHIRSAENFVPAYPLVHARGTGPSVASPSIMADQPCLVVTGEPLSDRASERVARLWTALGMRVSTPGFDHFEAAVVGHSFWPKAVAAAAARVARRGGWPEAKTALSAWLEQVDPPEDLDRCYQLYAPHLGALLTELSEEIHVVLRSLGFVPVPAESMDGE